MTRNGKIAWLPQPIREQMLNAPPDARGWAGTDWMLFPESVGGRLAGMALARILVDGYSLLHNWQDLAPGKPRYSMEARDELIRVLTLYRDAIQTPITIVFDGAGKSAGTESASTPELEILYSRSGQTADQIIERVAARMNGIGEVLAVTDDYAERDTVFYQGGMASSCGQFIAAVEQALQDQEDDIARHNRRQKAAFKATR
jgi:predicted RNA-binding protein with PIN domain